MIGQHQIPMPIFFAVIFSALFLLIFSLLRLLYALAPFHWPWFSSSASFAHKWPKSQHDEMAEMDAHPGSEISSAVLVALSVWW